MMGVHVMEVKNPGRNYPRGIMFGALAIVLIFILGTFAVGVIIPPGEMNITQSLLVGFGKYFEYVKMSWAAPILSLCLVFGVLAGVLTWVAGPSKGIYTVGKAGYLPPFFQKSNKNDVQINILLVQGAIVTVLSLLFVVMPSVQAFYEILSQLTVLLYLIMYMLMFASIIKLRYKMPNLERPFRIGSKNNILLWIVAGVGFFGSLLAFSLSFVQPEQVETGSSTVWYSVLTLGSTFFIIIPMVIYSMRKDSWKDKNSASEFAPFGEDITNNQSTTNS